MSKYGHIVKTDEELEPCPFCGGKGVLVLIDHKYFVTCDTCTCRVSSGYLGFRYYGDAEAEAVEAWNTRTPKYSEDTPKERTCHSARTDCFECDECEFLDAYAAHDAFNYCPKCGARVEN